MKKEDFQKFIIPKEEKLATEYPVKTVGDWSVKDIDMTKRVVEGVFNSYNFFDSDADVLLMGSTAKSIQEHGPDSGAVRKIKHALFHNLNRLPGKIEVLEERENIEFEGKTISGIYFRTRMAKTTEGTDTLINYQEKVYDNHSIGFRYLDINYIDEEAEDWTKYLDLVINPEDMEKAGIAWIVKEIELFEGSTVGIGMNELTPFLGIKSGDVELQTMKLNEKITIIEKQLRKGRQSDEALFDLSIQLRQVKQVLNELSLKTDTKSTPPKGPDTPMKTVSEMINEAKFNFSL